MPARNTIEIIVTGEDRASGVLEGMSGRMRNVGSNLRGVGVRMIGGGAMIVAALAGPVNAAMRFDEAMTNIQAVTNGTGAEMDVLSDAILEMGANSRFGPQAVAEAMYDVVGGVADATTHMAILEAAINTAEAGNADLGATTNALISIMNSYTFSADEASYASDVLTQTVARGVGTMDEFAAALPQVTGMANSLGISFQDVGGMMAYLTTQGNSASQAATQLSAMMTAMLNPNQSMIEALHELGYESGQAAIEQLGLMGAYEAIAGTQAAHEQGLARLVGSTEALRGATALMGPEAQAAMDAFGQGMEGATLRAQELQNASPAAMMDEARARAEALAIRLGEALLPALIKILDWITPLIDKFAEFVGQHPEVVGAVAAIAGILIGVGGLSWALGIVVGAVGLLLGPAGVIAAGVALGVVLFTQFGDKLRPIVDGIIGIVRGIIGVVDDVVGAISDAVDFVSSIDLNPFGERNRIDEATALYMTGQIDEATYLSMRGPGRDFGGPGYGGTPYSIGPMQQGNEIFIPGSNGTFVPDFFARLEALMGGGAGGERQIVVNVSVPQDVLAYEPGIEANGNRLAQRIAQQLRATDIGR